MRYYYDCWIKAVYMAKYFGMKFVGTQPAITYSFLHNDITENHAPYYIHDDSLHLLKPQKGDIYTLEWYCVKGSSDGGTWEKALNTTNEDGEYKTISKAQVYRNHKIIQRNNIPFIWPENEK